MSRLLKSFPQLPLKLLAFDTIDNRDVPLELLGLSLPGTSRGRAIPLEQAMQRSRDLLARVEGWHHGGINE
jgi:hypothetical protein